MGGGEKMISTWGEAEGVDKAVKPGAARDCGFLKRKGNNFLGDTEER